MILIPTTAGTGSEVSPYSVVKIGEKKYFPMSPFFYPDIAIIDPGLTISMPPFITASTGMDALSHAIEGMMHKNANPFCDALCLAGVQMIGCHLRRAVANGEDLEARYYMSLGATLCMMGMSMSGGLYAHSVSFVIGKYKPTPHGIGVALGLPYLMAFNLPVVASRLAKIAAALGEPIWMYSEQEAAKRAIHAVKSLMTDVGLPLTLKDYGISEKDLPDMANMMISLYPRPMNPRSMDQESSINYWRNMWNGML
jgi:alcohol dehydrogenase